MKPFAEKIFLMEIITQIKGARRALDPTKGIYRFLGEDFDLKAIMASLDRIFDAASERNKLIEAPSWGRDPSKE